MPNVTVDATLTPGASGEVGDLTLNSASPSSALSGNQINLTSSATVTISFGTNPPALAQVAFKGSGDASWGEWLTLSSTFQDVPDYSQFQAKKNGNRLVIKDDHTGDGTWSFRIKDSNGNEYDPQIHNEGTGEAPP